MHQTAWWELPRYPYRPQFLQLALILEERQPSTEAREIAFLLATALGREVQAPDMISLG